MSTVDLIAVVLVAVLNNILAMVWYAPGFLGTRWAEAHNFVQSDLKPTIWHIFGAFLVSFVTAFIFSLLVNWLDITTSIDGIKLGFVLWLGFIVTTHFSGVIWAKKSLTAYFIDSGFQLLSLTMMGAILGVW